MFHIWTLILIALSNEGLAHTDQQPLSFINTISKPLRIRLSRPHLWAASFKKTILMGKHCKEEWISSLWTKGSTNVNDQQLVDKALRHERSLQPGLTLLIMCCCWAHHAIKTQFTHSTPHLRVYWHLCEHIFLCVCVSLQTSVIMQQREMALCPHHRAPFLMFLCFHRLSFLHFNTGPRPILSTIYSLT